MRKTLKILFIVLCVGIFAFGMYSFGRALHPDAPVVQVPVAKKAQGVKLQVEKIREKPFLGEELFREYPEHGVFLLVDVTVANYTDEPFLFSSSEVYLIDSEGFQVMTSPSGEATFELFDKGNSFVMGDIPAGLKQRGSLVFDVPKPHGKYTLSGIFGNVITF